MRITFAAIAITALASVSYSTLAIAAPSAADVITANKAATGATAKPAVRIEYAYSGQGMTGKVTSIDDLRTGNFVDDAKIGPAGEVQGFDGTHAWTKDTSGSVTLQDGGAAHQVSVNEAYRRSNGWWQPNFGGATIVFAGEKTDNGNAYDALTVTPKDGEAFEAWFDAKSHLLYRVIEVQGPQTSTTTLSDYRDAGGVKIPYKTLVSVGDAQYDQTMTVTNVSFLPPQPASAFAAPKVVLNDYSIAAGAKETTFPFKLINNHIFADVKVNGKGPYQFIFDTGGVNLVTPPLAKELGLNAEGHMQGNGAGSGHMDVQLTKIASLQLGDATVKDQVFAQIPLDSMGNIEGVGMPGMVGFETFRRFVTRIDYGAHTITLIKPDAFNPKDAGAAVPISFNGNTIEAPATYDGVPGTFTIDTGNRSSIILNSPFVAAHAQFAKYSAAPEATTGWGIGGPTKSHVIRGHNLVIGDQTVAAPVVLLSTATKGADADTTQSGNIGGGVLKRFVVTLDYEHNKMYLKPVTQPVSDLDSFDRSGVWINQSATGYSVVDVTKGTPADQAGLKAGDEIVSVDGKPATATPLYETRARLRNDAPGTVVKFTVKRGGETKDVSVTLRDLI
ncbi:MAG TPA: aspartyl protease family protein [Rhizomicrobium sp.]|jgi:membrane-associated protease RseP (regulator of RpoE activity)